MTSVKDKSNSLFLFILVLFSGFFLLMEETSYAHKIVVFAWSEGDMAHVTSKFSGGRKVKNGEVTVFGPKGDVLLTGKTDDRGEFSFKIPQKTSLKVDVLAGMGHRGYWTIPADEIEGAIVEAEKPAPLKAEKPTPKNKNVGIDSEELRLLVEKAVEKQLEKKLKPMMDILADSRQTDPTFKDVMGGIGYIFGLIGVAAYFSRKKEKK